MKYSQYYPTSREVDAWLEEIWQAAQNLQVTVSHEPSPAALTGPLQAMGANEYLRFTQPDGSYFYAVYQPALGGPAPLAVHIPGYGSEVSLHPEIQAQGFSVLHVQPMGYMDPVKRNMEKWDKEIDSWPTLPDTVRTFGEGGYKTFLTQSAAAIFYAWTLPGVLPDRVSFFGTSQGGNCTLTLGSLFSGRGCRCVAADEPGFINMDMEEQQVVIDMLLRPVLKELETAGTLALGCKAMGYVDPMSHVHRLTMPVMLTSGTADVLCRQEPIRSLFSRLTGTKCYMSTEGMAHGHNREFTAMAAAWLRIYA